MFDYNSGYKGFFTFMEGLKDSHRKLAKEREKKRNRGTFIRENKSPIFKILRPPSAFLAVNGFCDKTGTAIVEQDVKLD